MQSHISASNTVLTFMSGCYGVGHRTLLATLTILKTWAMMKRWLNPRSRMLTSPATLTSALCTCMHYTPVDLRRRRFGPLAKGP
jgi:hypothetical protein